MLEKIETKEMMTRRAAMLKYRTKYFFMEITEVVDHGDNDLGFVCYTADSDDALDQVPISEYEGKRVAYMLGVAAEPFPIIGNMVYHD